MIFLSVIFVRDPVTESISYAEEQRHSIYPQLQGTAPSFAAFKDFIPADVAFADEGLIVGCGELFQVDGNGPRFVMVFNIGL